VELQQRVLNKYIGYYNYLVQRSQLDKPGSLSFLRATTAPDKMLVVRIRGKLLTLSSQLIELAELDREYLLEDCLFEEKLILLDIQEQQSVSTLMPC